MIRIHEEMKQLGNVRSVIRDTFEYGNRRAAEIGRENVFDFSLGNPSIPAPAAVGDAIRDLLDTTDSVALHGYTSAPGAMNVREAIAADLNRRFSAGVQAEDIYMTCGAAASLTVSIHALACPGDEFVVIAPFFPEYRVFVESAGAKLVVVPAETDRFQIDFDAFDACLTEHTKAVIVNTPNNPTGVIFSPETLARLAKTLRRASEKFGSPIFLIADEPYRELVYDDSAVVPYLPLLYDYTLVCYSFSKSLSLPGERIGYIAVPGKIPEKNDLFAAVAGAGRALGFVCAPSLFQQVIARCVGTSTDLSAYRENRDLLYSALTEYGFDCVHPDGAFYLFVKSPEPDAMAFAEKARKYELLLVPSDSFGCPGYVRIAYCVSHEMIRRSLPAFRLLAKEYGLDIR